MTNRREFLQTTVGAAIVGSTAFQQSWAQSGLPIEQVKVLYGFPPGSSGDICARRVAEKFGGPQAGQPASPFQFLLQKAGVVDAPSTDQEQLMGLLASLGGGSGTGSMSILSGPQSPNMGTLASDITAQNLASGGLRGKLEKMIMGMA